MNEGLLEQLGVLFEHLGSIAKHKNLVSEVRVLFDQILQDFKLLGVGSVKQFWSIQLLI